MGDADGAMEVGDGQEEDDGTLIEKGDMALVPLSGRLFLDKGFDESYVLADTQTLWQHVFHKHDHEGLGLELMFSDCGVDGSYGCLCVQVFQQCIQGLCVALFFLSPAA